MDAAGIVVLAINLVFGFGGAVLVGGMLAHGGSRSRGRWFVILLGIYLAESFAVCASMATMVLPIVLAFVWVPVFSRWLRASGAQIGQSRRTATWLVTYSALPALSLIGIPAVSISLGRDVISASGGHAFGIPEFIPWPLCSILGFFGAVSLGAFILKILITTRGIRGEMADG